MQYIAFTCALLLVAHPAFAVEAPTDLRSFLGILTGIANLLIPLLFALTFLTIAWGVIQAWIMGDSSPDAIESGKKIAFVGIIVLVVMSSIWGIVRILNAGIFGG